MNPLLEWGLVALLVGGSALWVALRAQAGIRAANAGSGKACGSCNGCGGCPAAPAGERRG